MDHIDKCPFFPHHNAAHGCVYMDCLTGCGKCPDIHVNPGNSDAWCHERVVWAKDTLCANLARAMAVCTALEDFYACTAGQSCQGIVEANKKLRAAMDAYREGLTHA